MTSLARPMVRLAASLHARGWMPATAGNLSRRPAGSKHFLVSASGGHKGRLRSADFVWVDAQGVLLDPGAPRPSAETCVHAALYREAGENVSAIVHVHGPWMTLVSRRFALEGEVRWRGLELIKALGCWGDNEELTIPIVPNHHDLPTLARAVREAVRPQAPAVLVAGHGVYAWGESLDAAERHVEAVEALCEMAWWEQATQS